MMILKVYDADVYVCNVLSWSIGTVHGTETCSQPHRLLCAVRIAFGLFDVCVCVAGCISDHNLDFGLTELHIILQLFCFASSFNEIQ